MDEHHRLWERWANALRGLGVEGMAAALLETAGPLTLVMAQTIYIGQPLLKSLLPGERLDKLAELLEEPEKVKGFTRYLREEKGL